MDCPTPYYFTITNQEIDMFKKLNGTFLDHRDEITLLIFALAIPLATLPSMIF